MAQFQSALGPCIGVALVTGTSIVPAATFSLTVGDQVEIALDGLGVLDTPAERVGVSGHGTRGGAS